MSANDVGDKVKDNGQEDDQEDIQWFEAYDKMDQIGEHLDSLKTEDILNYIKDVEHNCRLEMNSGDETSAADVCAKKASNYSVRCPAARVRSSKAIKSKLTPKKKGTGRKVKLLHEAIDARDYTRDAPQNSRFRANDDPKEKLNAYVPAESALRYPKSYDLREPSPRFYEYVTSRHRRVSATNLEIVADHAETMVASDYRGIDDSRMDPERKPTRRAFKKTTDKLHEPVYTSACCANVAPAGQGRCCSGNKHCDKCDKCAHAGNQGRGKLALKFDSPVDGPVEQRRLYGIARHPDPYRRQGPWRNEREREGRSYGYRYPLPRNSTQPASWQGRNLRSNRLASRLARLSLQRRALREHEIQLRGTTANDRNYLDRQSWQHENQRYPDGSSRLRVEGRALVSLSDKSKGLYGKNKLPLNYYYDDDFEGQTGETEEYYAHYRSPATRFRPRGRTGQSASYDDEGVPNVSAEKRRKDTATYDDEANVYVDDDDSPDRAELAIDLQPNVSPPNDNWTYRAHQSTKYYEELSSCEENDLQTQTLRRRIIQYSDDETRALDSPAREPQCKCREPLHSGPAACSVGSCACINRPNVGRNKNDHDDDDDEDSSPEGSIRDIYCPYCSLFDSKNDLVEKLEGKGNPNRVREQTAAATGHDARRYLRTNANANEQNAVEAGNEEASHERGWLKDGMRLCRPKFGHNGANVDCILIYPPRGEGGPPLTLYKGSSNINCRVKGNTDSGFRYSVTYVQKFVSPTWIPGVERVETAEELESSADHG